jgi:predicted nucleic acid-binding protein
MTGSIVDLSAQQASIPDPIVVDSNLLVERFLVPFVGVLPTSSTGIRAQRASQFFNELVARNGIGITTPTCFTEFVHVAIKFLYRQERLRLGARIRQAYDQPIRDWLDLYKADSAILKRFLPRLEYLRQLLIASGLSFITPAQLGSIPSGRSFDEELIHLVGTYGLDSNDALILMEAQRYGVTDIITLDTDLQRAQADFNIYTWL